MGQAHVHKSSSWAHDHVHVHEAKAISVGILQRDGEIERYTQEDRERAIGKMRLSH